MIAAAVNSHRRSRYPCPRLAVTGLMVYGLNLDWSLLASLGQQFDWALAAGYGREMPTRDVLARIDARPLRQILPSAVGIPYPDPGYEPAERRR